MRVLHLMDAVSPQATSTTLALVAESLNQLEHTTEHLVLLGGAKLTQSAATVGLDTATILGVPFGHAMLGWSPVRRYAQRHGPFDLIHCWSVGALSLATMLFRSVPRVLTLTVRPSQSCIGWIGTLCRESRSRTVLLPTSATIRQAILGGGVQTSIVHVLRPGINMSRIRSGDRDLLRASWKALPKSVKVMALLSDPSYATDPKIVATAMIMAGNCESLANTHLRLLVHPDQVNHLQLIQTIGPMKSRLSVIQEPKLARPWSILPGCDLALTLGDHAGGLAVLWAMAANVPIIGEATYAVSEIVEDHHSALLAQPQSAMSVAQRITQLLCSPELCWKLRDMARHEAYSFFSCRNYRQSLKMVYQQVIEDQQVQIPPMEASGGLRFTGRA